MFSVISNSVIRILRSESEVTQICTPGDDSILIAGTVHGSINLYDLKEFEATANRGLSEMDYDSLLRVLGYDPSTQAAENPDEYQEKLLTARSKYSVQWPTFSTDGLSNPIHLSPIRKLLFITKFGGGTNA